MARSFRKTPIFAFTTAKSEKEDKRRWNKTFRRISKHSITTRRELPAKITAVSDVWAGNKDGKRYWKKHSPKDMRK